MDSFSGTTCKFLLPSQEAEKVTEHCTPKTATTFCYRPPFFSLQITLPFSSIFSYRVRGKSRIQKLLFSQEIIMNKVLTIEPMSYSLKKLVFGSDGWTKHNIDFQQPQGVQILDKYDELSESVAFGQSCAEWTKAMKKPYQPKTINHIIF